MEWQRRRLRQHQPRWFQLPGPSGRRFASGHGRFGHVHGLHRCEWPVGLFVDGRRADRQRWPGLRPVFLVAKRLGIEYQLHLDDRHLPAGRDVTIDQVNGEVPEPATFAMAGLVLVGISLVRRCRQ
ncbi:MAG: PEP-CTERM sorting domain-containing protein [Acidobacteria bacterium]|nr:PEP-CTERM sorting domain-containing protein [Acidobacteriota bacterium]